MTPALFVALYVTIKQAAAMLSVSEQSISKLIKTGRLPACYMGRAVRIKASDLEGALPAYIPNGTLTKAEERVQ